MLNSNFFNKLGYIQDDKGRYSRQIHPELKISFNVYSEVDPLLGTEVEAYANDMLGFTGYWMDLKDFVTQFQNVLPPQAAEYLQQ